LRQLLRIKLKDIVGNDDLFLSKLKEVFVLDAFERNGNKELFELFVNKYKNQIKSFKHWANNKESHEMQSLKQLTSFEALEKLDIFENRITLFADCMETMAKNKKNLNTIRYRIHRTNTSIANKVLNEFKYFLNLRKLTFHMTGKYKGNNEILIKSLSDCKQLQNLSLMHSQIKDNFFEDIDLYCPQLISLKICLQSFKDQITDNALKSLAKLKHLKIFRLFRWPFNGMKFYSITDSGFIELINKSPELRETTFNTEINITQKSINALIELAISKPKIQFVHRFCAITDEEVFKEIYDLTKYKIPNNLRLKGSKRAFIDSLFNTTIFTLSMDSDSDSDYSNSSDSDSETSDSAPESDSSESESFNSSIESEFSNFEEFE
jgi:hypothetical protein